VPGVVAAFDIMRGVWADAGHAQALQTMLLDQPHECNLDDQRRVLDFLQQALGTR